MLLRAKRYSRDAVRDGREKVAAAYTFSTAAAAHRRHHRLIEQHEAQARDMMR